MKYFMRDISGKDTEITEADHKMLSRVMQPSNDVGKRLENGATVRIRALIKTWAEKTEEELQAEKKAAKEAEAALKKQREADLKRLAEAEEAAKAKAVSPKPIKKTAK